jgi:RimJ/RimL family protein N-acetyltransferase
VLELNQKVRIVPVEAKHADKMCQWMADPEVASNIGLRREPSLERTVEWIQKAVQDPTIRAYAILVDEDHVGNVVFDQIDAYLDSARFSIYIGEPGLRGNGVGSTAAWLAAKLAFDQEGLNKIWLTVHVMNQRAINVYTKLGFMLEGILRDEFWLNGKRLPVLRMSLLAREFTSTEHTGTK